MAQRLRAQGVRAEEFSFSPASKQRLAATLLSAINGGNLALYEAEGLRDELLGLRLVQTSSARGRSIMPVADMMIGRWRWR